jgi:hypothetical protein
MSFLWSWEKTAAVAYSFVEYIADPSSCRLRLPFPGKNKRLSKGKKGIKKKVVDPFSRKDWYDIKAPSVFEVKNVGKTLVNRSQGLKNANDSLKGRVIELSLGDLQKDEEQAFRKIKLRVEDVKVGSTAAWHLM